MTLTEKAAYLKGLSEGLTFDKNSAEGKLLLALVDLCSELAEEVARIDEDVEYVSDYCEELDEDLGTVEELLVEDDDDFDFDDEDDFFDDEDEDDFEDVEFYEMECPHCGKTIEFDASIDPETLTCPVCHKEIPLDISDLEALDGDDNV